MLFDKGMLQISSPYSLPCSISTILVVAGNIQSSPIVNEFLFLAIQYETSYDASKYFSLTVINFLNKFFSLFEDFNSYLEYFFGLLLAHKICFNSRCLFNFDSSYSPKLIIYCRSNKEVFHNCRRIRLGHLPCILVTGRRRFDD